MIEEGKVVGKKNVAISCCSFSGMVCPAPSLLMDLSLGLFIRKSSL
jgi:hypothetical protein